MKKLCALLLCILLLMSTICANATDDISVNLDGNKIYFEYNPIVYEGRTMIHLRSFAELFGYDINWDELSQTITLSSDEKDVILRIDDPYVIIITNNGTENIKSDVSPMLVNGFTYLPLRAVAEIFDISVSWNEAERTVELSTTSDEQCHHTFYFQNQADWQLPNFGSSYCWVTCYAMILNNIVGNVTPNDVAYVNEELCGDGAYCYHYPIVEKFGVRFGSAIKEDSVYFDSFVDGYATYIKNEEKDDAVAINAIKEALDNHPEGVMVRFEESPHTIVAVKYEDDVIYYNEPMPYHYGQYETENPYNHVEFEKTYPAIKGYKISDMAFLLAIDEY